MVKRNTVIITATIIILLVAGTLLFLTTRDNDVDVSNFRECAEADYEVRETDPRLCVTPDGQSFVEPATNQDDTDNEKSAEEIEIERILSDLPKEVVINGRTIVFDQQEEPQAPRAEYATYDPPRTMKSTEDPQQYTERHLREAINLPHISEQQEFFDYSVAFYNPQKDNQLIAFVKVENIPDDSTGAEEERFDFIVKDDEWQIDWYGKRSFCQRPSREFWQPSNQVCP